MTDPYAGLNVGDASPGKTAGDCPAVLGIDGHPAALCCASSGHPGRHVAAGFREVLATWTDDDSEPIQFKPSIAPVEGEVASALVAGGAS